MARANNTSHATCWDDDYYALLGLSQFASAASIRDAYKRAALRSHPDKNPSVNSTAEFQRLARAWETLGDPQRRGEYDRNYMTGVGLGSYSWTAEDDAELARETAEDARRRREDIDRETTGRWRQRSGESSSGSSSDGYARQSPFGSGGDSFLRAAYLRDVRTWKQRVVEEYTTRLSNWASFQRSVMPQIRETQSQLSKWTVDLSTQTNTPESIMRLKFQDAIARRSDKSQDPAALLAALLAARTRFITDLERAIGDSHARLEQVTRELESARRRYEEEEAEARDTRIEEALAFLGPRNLDAPLFSVLDRRGRAINCWNALSSVKRAIVFEAVREASEGPLHCGGEWQRKAGEYRCGRCGNAAFHIIAECGSAKCPGCGIMVCNNCHRDLSWLRAYEAWIMGLVGGGMFDLEFDEGRERERE